MIMNKLRRTILIGSFAALCIASVCHEAAAQNLTVATYNIRNKNDGDARAGNGWDSRYPWICSLIEFEGIDIFGSQEVLEPQLEDMLEALPEYGYVGAGRDDGRTKGEYAPIFYRTDRFTVLGSGWFWLSETPDVQSLGWGASYPRICVRAELKHTSGDVLDVYNVHLDHISTNAQLNGIKLVAERALSAGGNAIVAGDFNAGIESDCYAAISESFTDAADAPDSLNGYTYNDWGFFDHIGDSPIDHIFLSESLNAKIFRVLYDHIDIGYGKYYSDHFAIGVRFEID